MKRTMKKGFSMIELLFAMIIMAALAAIAIPSLSSGTDSATYTSMKSDAQAAYSAAQASYTDALNFDQATGDFTDTDDNGIADTGGTNDDGKIGENALTVSKSNTISLVPQDCSGDGVNDGIEVTVTNDNVDKEIYFDSCNDGKFSVQ